ncbi:response regulator [Crocinitomix algicola]|uniref:response regulator n=1 Tax=Crocinitomix algicola TaxID=1740263 RepID=UPI000872EA4E|nr:response regulator [Crocinitomix algicola]
MGKEQISVMLVDDSEVDAFLVEEVLKSSNLFDRIDIYDNSSEALNFILNTSDSQSLPDLILLDINMPVIDGFEFIDSVADEYDDGFEPVVFVVTSSQQMRDYESFDKQYTASEFLKKPIELELFKQKVLKYFPALKF